MPTRSKYATLDALIVGALATEKLTRHRLYTHGAGGYIHREIRELYETTQSVSGMATHSRFASGFAQALLSRRLQSLRNRGWVACSWLNGKWFTRAPEGAR